MQSMRYISVAAALLAAPGCMMPSVGDEGAGPAVDGEGDTAATASELEIRDAYIEGQLGDATQLDAAELEASIEPLAEADHFVRLDGEHEGIFSMVALTVRGGLDHDAWHQTDPLRFESGGSHSGDRVYVTALGCSGTNGPNGPWQFDEWANDVQMQMLQTEEGASLFEFTLDFSESHTVRGELEIANLDATAAH